jgi:hypothetical protein
VGVTRHFPIREDDSIFPFNQIAALRQLFDLLNENIALSVDFAFRCFKHVCFTNESRRVVVSLTGLYQLFDWFQPEALRIRLGLEYRDISLGQVSFLSFPC